MNKKPGARTHICRAIYNSLLLLLTYVIWGLHGIGLLVMLVIPISVIAWAFFMILVVIGWLGAPSVAKFGSVSPKILLTVLLVPAALVISHQVNSIIDKLLDKLPAGFYVGG